MNNKRRQEIKISAERLMSMKSISKSVTVSVAASFSAAQLLVAVWVLCLWNNSVLRRKHPGLIYVPQPGAVYTLRLRQGGGP